MNEANISTQMSGTPEDLISRQMAEKALGDIMPKLNSPDGSHPADAEIFAAQEMCVDCIETIRRLPSAKDAGWIPVSDRLPDRFGEMLVTFIPGAGTLWTRVIIAHYSDLMGIAKPCFWIGNVGKNDFANISSQVAAWMPLPEPYLPKEDT